MPAVVNQVDQPEHAGPHVADPSDGSAASGARFAIGAYLAVAGVLVVIVAASTHLLGRWPGYPVAPLHFPGSWLLEGWVRWDGNWYRDIVTNGYSSNGPNAQANLAYFPGYPMVMWSVDRVIGDSALAGIIVTFVSGLVAAVLFQRWGRARLDPFTAKVALGLLLLYPYAWYLYGAVYADALFLALAIGAFLLLEADRPVLAGLVGALASATRPVGIAVAVGLVLVTIERRGGFRHLRRLRVADAGVLLSFGGLVAWSAYQGFRWGNPMLFTDIEGAPGWDQPVGPRTWFKITFLQRLHHLPRWLNESVSNSHGPTTHAWSDTVYTLSILLQAVLVLGAIALVWVIWRRIGWGYAGYVTVILFIAAVGTKDFLGAGRYLIGAFPVFAALALVASDRPRLRLAMLSCSALLLAMLASAYARGYYLA